MLQKLNVVASIVATAKSTAYPWRRKPGQEAPFPANVGTAVKVPKIHKVQAKRLRARQVEGACNQTTECLFRLADKMYQQMPTPKREVWKAAIKKRHISAYDLWMSEALWLMNRGYNPPDGPSSSGGFTPARAIPRPGWFDNPCLTSNVLTRVDYVIADANPPDPALVLVRLLPTYHVRPGTPPIYYPWWITDVGLRWHPGDKLYTWVAGTQHYLSQAAECTIQLRKTDLHYACCHVYTYEEEQPPYQPFTIYLSLDRPWMVTKPNFSGLIPSPIYNP